MADVKQINSTTYSADGLGDVKPKVLIGGKDESKFIPNINMSFHDDEFFININRKNKNAILAKDKIDDKAEIPNRDTDIFHIDESGRLKWDIEFSEKPDTNVFTWELKCSNSIDFYYQGELTQDEINDGCTRPVDVIGSYAVYCNKKNNKYKTGKICHIPRPFVIDNDNKTEWCVLKIENNTLTITLPETFMQNASYPVTLDPTFGYNSTGASTSVFWYGFRPYGSLYNQHTASSGDTITQFSLYGSAASSQTIHAAAYTISSGDLSSRLGSGIAITIPTSVGWNNSATVSIEMLNGSIYGVAWDFIDVADDTTLYYDSSDLEYAVRHSTYEALPATWTTDILQTRIYSVYVTYAEGTTTGNNYYYKMNQ